MAETKRNHIFSWPSYLPDLLRLRVVGALGARNYEKSSYSWWVLNMTSTSIQSASAEAPGLKICYAQFSKPLSVHSAKNGYTQLSSQLGKLKVPVQVDSLTASSLALPWP